MTDLNHLNYLNTIDTLDSPKDECGIIGVHSIGYQAARKAYFGLYALQHRGQESRYLRCAEPAAFGWTRSGPGDDPGPAESAQHRRRCCLFRAGFQHANHDQRRDRANNAAA